jgi:hypothetical protein
MHTLMSRNPGSVWRYLAGQWQNQVWDFKTVFYQFLRELIWISNSHYFHIDDPEGRPHEEWGIKWVLAAYLFHSQSLFPKAPFGRFAEVVMWGVLWVGNISTICRSWDSGGSISLEVSLIFCVTVLPLPVLWETEGIQHTINNPDLWCWIRIGKFSFVVQRNKKNQRWIISDSFWCP